VTKARHPCHGLSPAMREAFERIAINLPPQAPLRTLDALQRRGLIDYMDIGGGRRAWLVPRALHAAWCQWCAEHVNDDGERVDMP
jgi:hypothetical protein